MAVNALRGMFAPSRGPVNRMGVLQAMSTNYFNAKDLLPRELIAQVLAHLPPDRRERVLLYLHQDYYAERDAKVVAAYDRAVGENRYRKRGDLYAALAYEFGLSPRRICAIVRERRPAQTEAERGRLAGKCAPARRAAISLTQEPRRGCVRGR